MMAYHRVHVGNHYSLLSLCGPSTLYYASLTVSRASVALLHPYQTPLTFFASLCGPSPPLSCTTHSDESSSLTQPSIMHHSQWWFFQSHSALYHAPLKVFTSLCQWHPPHPLSHPYLKSSQVSVYPPYKSLIRWIHEKLAGSASRQLFVLALWFLMKLDGVLKRWWKEITVCKFSSPVHWIKTTITKHLTMAWLQYHA